MEWKPIETAPKDGTEVLVICDGDVFQASYDGCWGFAQANYHGCGCCRSYDDKPTHWQPLPAPPC